MDFLHELIQSMSASEKGYFKKYASPQNGGEYVKLFDAIAAMDEYDEQKLIQKFKKAEFVKHLSRAKNYLYNSLMRTLLLYHEESSQKIIIRNLLNEAELLHNRGLLNQARKRIDKVKVIAQDGEWFSHLLDILNHQRRLCDIRIYKPEELEGKQVTAEIEKVMQQMANFFSYNDINQEQDRIARTSMLLRENELTEKLLAIQKHFLLQNEQNAISGKSILLFNYINYFNRTLLQDYAGALPYAKRHLEYAIENPKISAGNQQLILDSYNMLLGVLQYHPERPSMEKHLNDLRNLVPKNSWLAAVKFQYYHNYALGYYYGNMREKEFLATAEDARKKIHTYRHAMKDDLRLGIYIGLSEGYIQFGRYTEAADVIEYYRQNPPKDIRNDYQVYLLLYYLIAQYEAGNHKLVSNLLSNVGRFMKRTGEFSEIENLLLKVFSTSIDIPDRRTRNEALTEIFTKIKTLAKELGGGRWNNYVTIITPFVDARIKSAKYHDCIMQMIKDRQASRN